MGYKKLKYVIWKKNLELVFIHEFYEDKKYDVVQLSRYRWNIWLRRRRNKNSYLFCECPREIENTPIQTPES
jgi:hypothetical protein